MRVAVVGAGGLLGRHLCQELERDGGYVVRAWSRSECDVTEPRAISAAVEGAEVVVNCAAYTNVDGAERPEAEGEVYAANLLGPELLAAATRRTGALLLHISTDFVFDGRNPRGYDELDTPAPLSTYGHSKWAGEERVRTVGDRWLIARVQGLYGEAGGNFASKLVDLLRAGKPLRIDGERRVQPTWAGWAARTLVSMLGTPGLRDAPGTYHVSAGGDATWADFASAACERLGLPPGFQRVGSGELGAAAARPPVCLFRHRMLELHGLGPVPDWRVLLDQYLSSRGLISPPA